MIKDNQKPIVGEIDLSGPDGNAFMILGLCKKASRVSGWDSNRWNEFFDEATNGEYDDLLRTVKDNFDVVFID